jgi:hypothetical protein
MNEIQISGVKSNGEPKKVVVTNGGAITVQTTRVEQTVLANALAITDTTARTANLPDMRVYKDIDFVITNTCDQPVLINFMSGVSVIKLIKTDGTLINYYTGASDAKHSIPAGASLVYLSQVPLAGVNKVLPYKDYLRTGMVLRYKFDVAPTTGALTIELQGITS